MRFRYFKIKMVIELKWWQRYWWQQFCWQAWMNVPNQIILFVRMSTRFWYDIIWFSSWYEVNWSGPWSVILVRNSVVRSVSRLLVRYFWTGRKWFGSYWQVWWRQFKDVTQNYYVDDFFNVKNLWPICSWTDSTSDSDIGDKKSLKNISSSLLQAVAACCKLVHPSAACCKLKPVASSCHVSYSQSSQYRDLSENISRAGVYIFSILYIGCSCHQVFECNCLII